MKRVTFPLLVLITSLSGCAAQQHVVKPVEIRQYQVAKGNQIQLVASDLAVELGIDGIEWNNQLRPWDYKTLRTRTIDITKNNAQQAYFELFSDTGLLPYYDVTKNRVFIEPFKTQIKQTYNFEPSFNSAAETANALELAVQKEALQNGSIKEYQIYKGEKLQDTLNGWAKEGGFSNVIWYIKDQKQIDALKQTNKANMTVIERSPLLAIKALLNSVNNSNRIDPINFRVVEGSHLLVFHGLNQSEPFKVVQIEATNTKSAFDKLAKEYNASLEYSAPVYIVKESFNTVLTNRIQLSLNEVMAGYPLNISYIESTNTIKVEKQ
ncbi:hypothetical protein HUO09_17010 [Vibrio sp. Y2-5]|uniref:hypothetical protein n=1 Tax=Vibrio sp. Y2-5 TaxID=2743977 RepID=UPI0016613F6C|nr:hypothetical protein [Vibrio sp. Y2-5]MBD0788056.1 hypothetical protein [Vibrio sp. Y2-5]